MKQKTQAGVVYYQSPDWRNVKHGIFTRHGGKSQAPWASLNVGGTVGDDLTAVRENHALMYETLGVRGDRSCTVWQVHGADVVVALGPVEGRRWLAQADSIITNQPETPLVMRYADCLPILFYDPVQSAVGIAHAGWRGTVGGVGSNTVRAMSIHFGSQPEDIQAIVGPGISQDCFQVGEEVVEAFKATYESADDLIRRDPADGTAYIDLWEANRRDLIGAGVQHVEIVPICTYQNTDLFFSHRGENGKTGRFGAVISL